MSGVAAIVTLLKDSLPLLADMGTVNGKTAASRIVAGDLPLKTPLPALSVHSISDTQRNTVSMSASSTLMTERVQVTIHAGRSYPQQKALLELVRKACRHRTGTIGDVSVLSILSEGAGADLPEGDTGNQVQTRDFIVRWRASDDGEVFPPGPERPTLATIYGNGAPVSGAGGTGAGSSSPGRIYIDQTNGVAYINESQDVDSPAWKLMAREG